MNLKKTISLGFVLIASALFVAACGGSSDSTDGEGSASASSGGGGSISLVAYAVPKVGFDKLIPAFNATSEGQGVAFKQSYGASGDQSRKVEAGLKADLVNFSVEPDITRLVDAGRVAAGWNANANKGVPFGSVVTIIRRKGDKKTANIKTWDDLLAKGIEVVTPNPFSSGSAKWNLLAPYAEKSQGGKNEKAGLDYLDKLIGDHIKVQPKSGREATETFLQGAGDVLLSYENEALFIERGADGKDIEHVTPPTTFKIENPVAVLEDAPNKAKAQAFADFLYTPEAQKLWAEAGFRPVDETVAKQFASDFARPEKLWTIADLGGWKTVNDELFDEEKGSVAKIYEDATG